MPKKGDYKPLYDIIGQKFGMLTVVEYKGYKISKYNKGIHYYLCRCDCGNTIVASADTIKYRRKSCGCLQKKRDPKYTTTHGMSKTRLYRVWTNLKNRCTNPSVPEYKNYGGRGIKVCDRWLGVYGFRNFLNDMGAKPNDKTMGGRSIWSLDRIDVDGDYTPENCRWATIYEQSRNRRNNRLVPCIKYLKDKNKKYCLDFRAENKIFNKCYYTLEEAIAARDELTEKYLDKWYN